MFLEVEFWNIIKNSPHIPTTVVNDVSSPKLKSSHNNDDHKKVLYDKKAVNNLASSLGMDEFFRIYDCKTAKEIWDTL